MNIGFTGSRWGMGEVRKPIVSYIADKLKVSKAGHGMCAGGDTEFHDLIRALKRKVWIKGYPPTEQGKFFVNRKCDELQEPKEYLDRDRDIVDEADVMIATPETAEEKRRSGTWYTIRYAKKVIKSGKGKCKKLYIVKPDGKVDYFDYDKLNEA
jgi:hypothetical protein